MKKKEKRAGTIKYKAKEKNGIYAFQIRRRKKDKKDALFIVSGRSEKDERKRGMIKDYAHIHLVLHNYRFDFSSIYNNLTKKCSE